MQPSSRHLAAIMFTDIVGYSALMQADEAKALELLEKHWQIVRPAFNRHNGREIKTIGDAFLVEFSSALHAVYAALDIQSALAEHNRSAKEEDRISIRIGIHLGDVEQRENDVFGDGVNIASRIEPLAPPGGVCITEPVYDLIKNKVEKRFHPLGPQSLKNIGDPVSVYSSDPIQQKPEQSATGQGINVWLTTLVQVILNPGKSALRYGENPGSMVGPVKLIIVVIAIFIVTTFFLPYPDEFTTSEIVLPEYLPYAAQVLDHEMIDKTKLDNQLAQIETVYNFIFNLVLILIMALAMRLVDGKRFLSTHFTVVAYAFVPATFFGDTTLALLGALDASTEVIIKFSAIGNFLLIFYLVYAIFSSYRPRILVPLYQTFVVFVTFVISSVPLVFTMHITQIIFARTVYGDYVDRNGNMDIYLASVIESNGSLKIVRENNATHHTGLDEAPSFTKDGNYMLYVSKEGEEKRDVYLFNLKSEERSRLTNTEDIDEHAPGEFPGGGLAVIRDAALWVYPDNEEAYPLSPEGEAVDITPGDRRGRSCC